MKKSNALLLTLFLTLHASPAAFAHTEPEAAPSPCPQPQPTPNPDADQIFDQTRRSIEEQCTVPPDCREERVFCFMDRVHQLKETAQIEPWLFQRLLRHGELRFSFCNGLREGHDLCRNAPPPNGQPPAQPSPAPTPAPDEKVTICHKPPGNKKNAKTLSVGSAAVSAHLAHGDSLGACPEKSSGGKKKESLKK